VVALVFIPETSNGDLDFAFFLVQENTVPFLLRISTSSFCALQKICIISVNIKIN